MRNKARLFNPSTFYADQLLNETAIGFSTTERLEIVNNDNNSVRLISSIRRYSSYI
ncbi:hypothetical protein DAPPUDRAFT_253088 [Daphnia pulex]|uniref:Uncharacterized protein n=1 Tax=Daphnia pulex TaxID=6669 RepID=E9H457_DAPPU|nr:hypothetical protein DAPPUDRAFT_253088 [Daphnia pulex]|eukprot:EFX73456.1 hypothetical protein DAPPUDRAFT_253088 [Daphnia pulex]